MYCSSKLSTDYLLVEHARPKALLYSFCLPRWQRFLAARFEFWLVAFFLLELRMQVCLCVCSFIRLISLLIFVHRCGKRCPLAARKLFSLFYFAASSAVTHVALALATCSTHFLDCCSKVREEVLCH